MTANSETPKPPSLAGASWLEAHGTQAVFRAITEAGFSARIVGGAVRNALFDRDVKDVDFATTARPEDMIAIAAAAGLTAVPTGIAHGTITVIAGHTPYEVTTLREDVETFGRHARVAFTEDWAADARRRDFTINALYCDAQGAIDDPLGGYPDLVARRVRFIGNAVDRIREDYLRILRFFRFHAEYAQGAPDVPSLQACAEEKGGLKQLSGERIRAELLRLLAAPGAVASIEAMATSGILAVVLGADAHLGAFEVLVRIETELGAPADPILRLASLTLPALPPSALKSRLKLSTAEADRLYALQRNFGQLNDRTGEADAKVLLYRLGPETFRSLLMLEWARSGADGAERAWLDRLSLVRRWAVPVMPVRGADLIARGVPPGRQIGQVLAALESWWIGEGFPTDEARIAAKLQELLGKDNA